MFNEELAVEIVQRNLIMMRNSLTEPNTLKRKVFALTEVSNHLKLKTTNGLGVRKLVELCDMLNVSIDEMFYYDESWDFDEPWDYRDFTKIREFKPNDEGLNVNNYGEIIAFNIEWSNDMGISSQADWWETLRSHNMAKLATMPNTVNFGTRLLGKISDDVGVLPEDLFYVGDYKKEES